MRIPFYKYHGTGNDFVIINQRLVQYFKDPDAQAVAAICHRRFGIGADGLLLLENSQNADFRMIYYNADGRPSTMCGNGGRCIVHLAHSLKMFRGECSFEAPDGLHRGVIGGDGTIELSMNDVHPAEEWNGGVVLDTGSPHIVFQVADVDRVDVLEEGREIRYHDDFSPGGINVNFMERKEGHIKVRTYERGVEGETYSCGTGVTAAALAAHEFWGGKGERSVETKGGQLTVRYKAVERGYTDIWLCGPAQLTFEGVLDL